MSNVMTAYGKQRLQQMGWPEDLDLRYDVSFCQGSGSSFTVEMGVEELMHRYRMSLRKDLVGRERVRQLRESRLEERRLEIASEYTGFSIHIKNDSGCRYVHENSVDVEVDEYFRPWDLIENLKEEAERDHTTPWDACTEEEWEEWAESWRLMVKEWHEEDARTIHSELENISLAGCHSNEDGVIWRFRTQKIMVEFVKESSDRDYGMFDDLDVEAMYSIAKGEHEYCDLVCTISLIDEDGDVEQQLVSLSCGAITYTPERERQVLMDIGRDLAYEMLAEARELLKCSRKEGRQLQAA